MLRVYITVSRRRCLTRWPRACCTAQSCKDSPLPTPTFETKRTALSASKQVLLFEGLGKCILTLTFSLPQPLNPLSAWVLHCYASEGTIPAELGQLRRLKRLRLSSNALSGGPHAEVVIRGASI